MGWCHETDIFSECFVHHFHQTRSRMKYCLAFSDDFWYRILSLFCVELIALLLYKKSQIKKVHNRELYFL